MDFNVFDYATRREDLDKGDFAFYEVDPGQMYPAMIAHATAVIEANDMSQVPRDQRRYVAKLRPLGDLEAANVHVDEAAATVYADKLLDTRETILETLRLWFTRMLKTETGPGLGLKITSEDPAVLAYWRLRPKAA